MVLVDANQEGDLKMALERSAYLLLADYTPELHALRELVQMLTPGVMFCPLGFIILAEERIVVFAKNQAKGETKFLFDMEKISQADMLALNEQIDGSYLEEYVHPDQIDEMNKRLAELNTPRFESPYPLLS